MPSPGYSENDAVATRDFLSAARVATPETGLPIEARSEFPIVVIFYIKLKKYLKIKTR
jgi:hypothetical protein